MSSPSINKVWITVSIVSDREPPENTTALLNEDVPINTHRQLVKNLYHWNIQFRAVEWVTRQLYKSKYSLTEKAEKVKEVLTLTSKITGGEHYWVVIMTTLLLKTIANTTIFSKTPGCKKTFCLLMCKKLNKLATILDKTDQGGHRWGRIKKNMKKKLVKLGKQNNYYLCLHPDELTSRMLVIPLIRMLMKTIDCLDQKREIIPTPQPAEEKKEPHYRPKQKKKKKKKLY